MASTAFELEETDDDFFDKLVADDDDIICPRSVTSIVDGVDLDEVKAFSNVSETGSVGGESVGDIGFGDGDDMKGGGDEVLSVPCDSLENNSVVTDANVLTVSNVIESSFPLFETEGSVVNSSLSVGDIGFGDEEGVKRVGDEVVSVLCDSLENNLVVTDTNVPTVSNVVESSVTLIKTEGLAVNSSFSVGGLGFGDEYDVKRVGDEVVSVPCDSLETDSVVTDTNVPTVSNVVQSSVALIETEGLAVNSSLTGGVKEIDWSAFNSAPHIHSGVGTGSYSDLFNNDFGENSEDPFAMIAENSEDPFAMVAEFKSTNHVSESPVVELKPEQNEEVPVYATAVAQTVYCQDLNSSQYEDLYPGWRYDLTTGQWHQLDDTVHANENLNVRDNTDVNLLAANDVVRDHNINYLQRTTESVAGSVAEVGTTETVSNWNQGTQENAGYPGHMVFDPQYPGWYYDTNVLEWQLLESYTSTLNQSTILDQNQQKQNANIPIAGNLADQNYDGYGRFQQVENYQSPVLSSPNQIQSTHASVNSYNQSNLTMWQPPVLSSPNQVQSTHTSVNNYNQSNLTWQPEPVAKTFNVPYNQQFATVYGSAGTHHQSGFNPSQENIYGQTGQGFGGTNGNTGFQSYVHAENVIQKIDQSKTEPIPQMNDSSSYFESKTPASFPQPPLGSFSQFSHATSDGRSSDGRPPHALVTFGFGGKLIVMRESNSGFANSKFNNQDSAGGVVNVFNMAKVVMGNIDDSSSIQFGARDYFQPLCQRSFPGPLVGGSVGSKELNKWIDDKIANSDYSDPDCRKGEICKMLFSLLKISCQYYGKLRSPFGSDQALKDDCPESAVSKLFASDRNHGALLSEHGAHKQCLQDLPPEPYSQAIAHEVQKLLVSGRKQEALKCAQEGKLWGPALVLATQLGDENFSETVKQMSLQQLVAGSPLRTLCLLIGGQPADVFCNSPSYSNMSGPFNIPQQPTQTGSNCLLDEWKENLAIITANRTKEDELVIIHLGDCLWKERDQVTAAHICYLVAEANFESHSDSARLCLIGADHWKFPRTYATPEAIQRTELYEYSKVLGNPQFLLLPFQPYKILYAHMLAEVGKLSDSLKYCQAIAKSLKTGRDPNVDNWKQLVSSLEERIKTHQQGGYGANMAPGKLVGKLFNFFDNTAHRVVGLPPPVPTSSHNKVKHDEPVDQGPPRVFNSKSTMAIPVDQGPPRVFNSQSTMAMSTIIPSMSVEPLNEWTGAENLTALPNRSISEPDFSKAPKKVDSPKKENSEKTSAATGSRFGRFGSQIFQKTVGLVLRPRPHKQAKLGDKNTFYYDEKLKRWVEEGANPPAEEAALPPPPTTAIFQNGVPDQKGINFPNGNLHTTNGAHIKSSVTPDLSPGIPPTPPTANQFSSRGRMSARARYVDTFNKGGGTPTNLFQPPSIPTAKSAVPFNPSFFIPAATSVSTEETSTQPTGDSTQEANVINEDPSTSHKDNSLSSPPSSPVTMQRFPSMDHIELKKKEAMTNSIINPQARRTLSWSGDNLSYANNPVNIGEIKPLRPTFGMSSSLKIMHASTGQNTSTENLLKVEP